MSNNCYRPNTSAEILLYAYSIGRDLIFAMSVVLIGDTQDETDNVFIAVNT